MSHTETRPFDPANYLDTTEAIAAYMAEAVDSGDPVFIADALDVVARAKAKTAQPQRSRR